MYYKHMCIYIYNYVIYVYMYMYIYVYIYTYFNYQPWLLVSWDTIHLWVKFNTSSHNFKDQHSAVRISKFARLEPFIYSLWSSDYPSIIQFFPSEIHNFYGNFHHVWWSIPMVVPWPWPWPRNFGPACSPWGCERFPHDIGLLRCARLGIHPRVASVFGRKKHGFQWDIHGKWDI